jgi:hypothetical protein
MNEEENEKAVRHYLDNDHRAERIIWSSEYFSAPVARLWEVDKIRFHITFGDTVCLVIGPYEAVPLSVPWPVGAGVGVIVRVVDAAGNNDRVATSNTFLNWSHYERT